MKRLMRCLILELPFIDKKDLRQTNYAPLIEKQSRELISSRFEVDNY
jgi:hypothetical protein